MLFSTSLTSRHTGTSKTPQILWRVVTVIGLPVDALSRAGPDTSALQLAISRDRRFDPFRDRLVVEWGKSALSWHQWLDQKDKAILELRPPGFVKEFTGYLDFTL